MYIDNLVNDFYNSIRKHKVLILVNYDIDGICAIKILQWLFRHDTVIYTIVPVITITDLVTAYNDHKNEHIKYVLLINCGGTVDIVEILEPDDDVIFFVADSHRPTDVCNVYSSSQIRMLSKAEDEEDIPQFDDIFKDEDEESEVEGENDDSDVENSPKRRRMDEEMLLKRRERRIWEEERKKIMFEYTQFSYYGRSTAILMFELAWKLHRDNVDVLWWGIIGVTEQLILNKVEMLNYINEVSNISTHVGRLCPNVTQSELADSNSGTVNTTLRIHCDKDLQLALYRHWTIESSLKYTMFTAVALKLWAIKGDKRLHQLLAEMGLPLVESRQQYSSMDLGLRKELPSMIEKVCESHKLGHVMYPSFTLIDAFKTRYQASDYVYAMIALLSYTSRGKCISDCFYDALDSLSRSKSELLNNGIEEGKHLLTCIFRHVQNSLSMKHVISAGPFFYLIMQQGTLNAKYYTNADCLLMLAMFALRAHAQSSKKKKSTRLPLVASVSLDNEYCLVAGVPPIAETTPKSFFGKAFQQAAERAQSSVTSDYFDSTVIKMLTADRPKFFDALTALLS